jgi:GAF domain-containing protein
MEHRTDRYSYDALLAEARASRAVGRAFRASCMAQLDRLDGFDWSGVYRLEGDTLVLDEFVGAPTDHTCIPVGVGVCGTAVAQDHDQLVADVRDLENYLACSLETRSEAVVLIRRDGVVLGQIDIDGHQVGRFGAEEHRLLTELAALMAERWDEASEP